MPKIITLQRYGWNLEAHFSQKSGAVSLNPSSTSS